MEEEVGEDCRQEEEQRQDEEHHVGEEEEQEVQPASTAGLIQMMFHLVLSGNIWLASDNVHDIHNYSEVFNHEGNPTSKGSTQGSNY